MSFDTKVSIARHKQQSDGSMIDQIFDNLTRITNEDIVKLNESFFVANFLPLFAGEKVPPQTNPAAWAAIAGNPYKPVHIVDDKTKEVLYMVPALFDRHAVTPGKEDQRSSPMSHVMTTVDQLNAVSPQRASHYLETQLNMRNLGGGYQERVKDNIAAWNLIFARYNKPLIVLEGGVPVIGGDAKTNPSQPSESAGGAQLSFDDDSLL